MIPLYRKYKFVNLVYTFSDRLLLIKRASEFWSPCCGLQHVQMRQNRSNVILCYNKYGNKAIKQLHCLLTRLAYCFGRSLELLSEFATKAACHDSNGNVFRVLKLPVSIYFPFSKLMLWPFSHEIRYFAKLSLACFVLDIYKKCWHMTSHWTMTFWNDVTLHNDFLKKLPDLGISFIEIIKPFICVVATCYKSILYVDKFESVIYKNLALYRVSQKSDTIEIILLL
jgi:hypothetical protein